jgi:hypothetical protein
MSFLSFHKKYEKLIERYCAKSGKKFNNIEEKLCYYVALLPSVATEGTKYEKFHSR